jgi:purine-nucleoside phosphorylase
MEAYVDWCPMWVFPVDLSLLHMTYESAIATAAFLEKEGVIQPDAGIILGTGLSGLPGFISHPLEIPYSAIPGFPLSTVESHAGKLIYGDLAGKKVVIMQGRFHFYEGYDFVKATFPIRVLHATRIRVLMLSNAAGSLNPDFHKGALMLLDDHINLLPGNPLIGPNDDRWGPRFPDMGHPYNENLNAMAMRCAAELGVTLHKGMYAAVPGPNLETRAEYRFLMKIGADAVGMSTVPEVITAHHMGLPCVAVSVLTDECDPDHLVPVSLQEIIQAAQTAEPNLNNLFLLMLKNI